MDRNLVKNALFGAIGGVTGTFIIEKAIGFLTRFQSERDKRIERQLTPENPPEKLAGRLAYMGLGVELSKEQRRKLGKLVSWGYGTFWGAVYGVLRYEVPSTSKFGGLAFGVAFGLFSEGVLLPITELTPSAYEYPATMLVRDLVAHYAYAATVEGTCSILDIVDRAVTSNVAPRRTNVELRRVS